MKRFDLSLSGEEYARVMQRRERADAFAAFVATLDPGIRRYVEVFHSNGIETVQSCEGKGAAFLGGEHSYAEPTIEFTGSYGAAWWAVQVCHDNGLPIRELRRVWSIENAYEPTGPLWAIVFRECATT